MNMNGTDKPVAIDLGGPLFADAAGQMESIACLPLAEGYTTTYRNLDVLKQKVKLQTLKVAGSESVTVPAGTFDTYRVEISDPDGLDKETLWITKNTHTTVKLTAVLGSMGGAVLTSELLP